MRHHTDGDRPLVLVPEDLARVEAVPLAGRGLPASTYELLRRTAANRPRSPALHLLGEGAETTWTYADLISRVHQAANLYTPQCLIWTPMCSLPEAAAPVSPPPCCSGSASTRCW